jgi:hypothetical protein
MHYEEETLIKSPFFVSIDDEEEEEIEEGTLGDDVLDELGVEDDIALEGPSWDDADKLDEDEEEIEEEF